MSIDKEKVYELGELAMIKLSEEEAVLNAININSMMEKVDKIKELDVDDLTPAYNPNDLINPLRKDVVGESLESEEVLKNTEEQQYGYFKILRVVD